MHLAVIFAVILAVASVDDAAPNVAHASTLTLWLVVNMGLWLSHLVLVNRTLVAWQYDTLDRYPLRTPGFWVRHFAMFWLLLNGLLLYASGLPHAVRETLRFPASILDYAVAFSAAFCPLALAWSTAYELHRWPRAIGILHDSVHTTRWHYMGLRFRHYVMVPLIPVVLVIAARDTALYFRAANSSRWIAVSCVVVIGTVVVLLPYLLRWMWQSRTLSDGNVREMLVAWIDDLGIRVSDICEWRTGNQIVNAAVCGILPQLRYIFITDGLLRAVSGDGLRHVVAHELAHVQRRHFVRILLVVTIPLLAVLLLPGNGIGSGEAGRSEVAIGIVFATGLAVLLGFCGRVAEHEADLWACLYLSGERDYHSIPEGVREAYLSTLRGLEGVAGTGRRGLSWLHPSLSSRERFLRSVAADAGLQRMVTRRARRWVWGNAVLVGLVMWLIDYVGQIG